MIYIIDNGESYSSHTIWFVRSSLSLANMKILANLRHDSATVEGMADQISWVTQPQSIQDYDWMYFGGLFTDDNDEQVKEETKKLPLIFIKKLIRKERDKINKMDDTYIHKVRIKEAFERRVKLLTTYKK